MAKILIVIDREPQELQTLGSLSFWKDEKLEWRCKTLELPWVENMRNYSCIPAGFYRVARRNSTKYGDHLHILGVPNRDMILIHHGNYAASKNPKTGKSDIRGCILVGSAFLDLNGDGYIDITNSRNTMQKLMSLIAKDDEISIKINTPQLA